MLAYMRARGIFHWKVVAVVDVRVVLVKQDNVAQDRSVIAINTGKSMRGLSIEEAQGFLHPFGP